MQLTKPAGVFMQLMGVVVFVIGVALLIESWHGLWLMAACVWMMWEGGKPAMKGMSKS